MSCEVEQGCDEPGHGRWYIGPDGGRGFRTNRCPRSWADSDFVRAVQIAHWWREGGAFQMHVLDEYGHAPPALLMDVLPIYGTEVIEAQMQHQEEKQAEYGRGTGWKERTRLMLQGDFEDD